MQRTEDRCLPCNQHSNVEYKEDGDILIDTSVVKKDGKVTDKGIDFETGKDNDLIKYSIKAEYTDKDGVAHNHFKNNVEEINVNKVMPED